MAAYLPGVFNVQLFTDTGAPAAGFRLYTYAPSTTTHKAAYTDAAATTPHTYTSDGLGGQYIALNARGELPAWLYLTSGGYDLCLKTSAGATVWTRRAEASVIGSGASSSSVLRETQTATASQAAFTLANEYIPNSGALAVYVDGLLISDYAETDSRTVTLTTGLSAGQQVTFFVGQSSTSGVGLADVGTGTSDHVGGASDQAGYLFRRRASYSGGTAGFVNSAIRTETIVSPGATAYEWVDVSVLNNYATAGENVAKYSQGNKYGTGPTWASVSEAIDWTATANPTAGLIGHEVDVRANGTDNNNNRVGIDVVVSRPLVAGVPTGAAMVATTGIRLQNGGDASASYAVGFDTTQATITQAAIKFKAGQTIAWNETATRQSAYDGIGLVYKDNLGNLLFRANDSGIPQFGILATAAATPGSFAANKTIRIQQQDGVVLYIPAMLATW